MESKKLQIAVVASTAILVFGMMGIWTAVEKREQAKVTDVEQRQEYDRKIEEIKDSLKDKEKELKAQNEAEKAATVILAFSEENTQLEWEIFPKLTELGISATAVLKVGGEYQYELLTSLYTHGWDMAAGGAIGEDTEYYKEQFKALIDGYEANTGIPMTTYFFNGKEYTAGSKLLYPEFTSMSVEMSAAFSKDSKTLNYGFNDTYGKSIEECQNISMREDLKQIQSLVDQAVEKKSVIILSDFGMENQMEIQSEGPLEQLDEILMYLTERQGAGELQIRTAGQYLTLEKELKIRREERKQEYLEYEQICQDEIKKLKAEKAQKRAE